MAIFIHFSGITGSATDESHQGWSVVDSLSFSCKRSIQTKPGISQDRETGLPYIGEVELIKQADKASPYIFQNMLDGSSIKTVTIDVCHTGKTLQSQVQYTLENVLVSHYENTIDSNSQHQGSEYITLNFSKIEKKMTPYNSIGQAESPITVGYDVLKAQKS